MTHALLTIIEIVVFLAALLVGWLLTVVNLPGTWLIAATSLIYAWLVPDDQRWDLSWTLVGVLTALAVAGEVVETLAVARGAKKLGASRRAALLAIVGSLVGAGCGTGFIPIPIVGTVIGACLGALIGAMFGEVWKGRTLGHSLRVGRAAFGGRLQGTLAKILIASVMVAVAAAGVVLR